MQFLSSALGLLLPFLFSGEDAAPRVQWLDVDNDGRNDALIVGARGNLHLLLADEGARFVEAGPSWGLAALTNVLGVSVGSDGRLVVLFVDRGPRLLERDGATFVDATAGSGLEHLGVIARATFVDYDHDGRLDLEVHSATGGVVLFHADGGGLYRPSQLVPTVAPPAAEAAGGPRSRPKTVAGEEPVKASPWSPVQTRVPQALLPSTPSAPSASGGTGGTPSGAPDGSSDGRGPTIGSYEPLALGGGGGGCASDLVDQSGGACIPASSAPLPGHLLPLGPDLFVNPGGWVGLGTETPASRLHVNGINAKLLLTSTNVFSQQTHIEMGSVGSYDEGMVLSSTGEGFGIRAKTEDRFGVIGVFGPHLHVGKSTSPQVGIGTTDPEANLHVTGQALAAEYQSDSLTGEQTVSLKGFESGGEGAFLSLGLEDGDTTVVMDAEAGTRAAELLMFHRNGAETVDLSSQGSDGSGGMLLLRRDNGVNGMVLDAQTGIGAELGLWDTGGTETVEIVSEESAGNGAQIRLRKADGTTTITLDADQSGDGRIRTQVLEITGGSDLVEGFDTDVDCPPGSVVVIDETRAGELTLSRTPYDFRVAGVVSGAGGVKPGLRLAQAGVLDGDTQVALTGRVYVRCTTENGPIRPGQLLTTSSSAGAAMRATDAELSNGAVLGKAMGSLDSGEGLVLVLVNLQ